MIDGVRGGVGVRTPRPASHRTRWAATGALAAAALVLAGCSADEEPSVEVSPAVLGAVTEVVEAPATVAARASAVLTAPADGRVAELAVGDGGTVAAGDAVLRLAAPEAEQRLAEARQADVQAAASSSVDLPSLPVGAASARADERATAAFAEARAAAEGIPDPELRTRAVAALAAAEADYAAARADAERAVRRFNAGLGSLGEALSSLGQAQRVQTQAAVAAAEGVVAALDVRAPVGGVVSLGTAGGGSSGGSDLGGLTGLLPDSLGDLAGDAGSVGGSSAATGPVGVLAVGSPVASGQVIATVTDVSSLSLVAEVDETDVLLVQPGVKADVELDALPGATYAAEVASVDVAPAASGGGGVAYRVRLALGAGTDDRGEPAPAPRPGMSSVVGLAVREVSGVVTVPTSAVVRDGSRDAVWVVEGRGDDRVVRRRQVRLGAQGEGTVEVAEGLRVREQVVVRGADRVRDGQRLPDQ